MTGVFSIINKSPFCQARRLAPPAASPRSSNISVHGEEAGVDAKEEDEVKGNIWCITSAPGPAHHGESLEESHANTHTHRAVAGTHTNTPLLASGVLHKLQHGETADGWMSYTHTYTHMRKHKGHYRAPSR